MPQPNNQPELQYGIKCFKTGKEWKFETKEEMEAKIIELENPANNQKQLPESLTRNQYEILVRMDIFGEWYYPYSHFKETGLDLATLKKEIKILRDLGLVRYQRGLMDDDGMVAGSGHGISYKKTSLVSSLLKKYEENGQGRTQLPEWLEQMADITHDVWRHWMKHLFTQGYIKPDGSFIVKPEAVRRWKKQISLDYHDLTEREKQTDKKIVNDFYKFFVQSQIKSHVEEARERL